jgi:hypothetical protein
MNKNRIECDQYGDNRVYYPGLIGISSQYAGRTV